MDEFKVRDKRKKGWFYLDNEYLNGLGKYLGPNGIAVYVALCRHAGDKESCYPSQQKIAEETGMDRKTVNKYLNLLVDHNVIVIQKRKNIDKQYENNVYFLLDKSVWKYPEPCEPNTHGHGELVPKPWGTEGHIHGNVVPTKNTHIKNTQYKKEDDLEINQYLGFPLPDDWADESYYESEGTFVPRFLDGFSRPIKAAEIRQRKMNYDKAQKSKATKQENKDSLESKMVTILKEVQNISHLDGVNNLDSAKTLKNALQEHLLAEFDLDTRNDTERFLREFRAILGHIQNKSPFHWKNATSIGYLTRNLNKIIRDIK
jgi:hypothetical protein